MIEGAGKARDRGEQGGSRQRGGGFVDGLHRTLSSALVREWMAAPLRGAMEANSNGLRLIGSSARVSRRIGHVAWPTQMGTALKIRVM